MGTFSTINHEIWSDSAFLSLSPEAKLLFLYSWTHSPMASITGIDVIDHFALMDALGWGNLGINASEKNLERTLKEVGRKPLVKYDWGHSLLWAVNRMKFVCPSREKATKKVLSAATNHLTKLPASVLVEEYREKYGALLRA